jgi:hypothetical protein
MHVKGTRRDTGKPRNVSNAKVVENAHKKNKTSRSTRTGQTYSSVVKNANTADIKNTDSRNTDPRNTEHTEAFLGVGLANHKPPLASGAGSGEEMKKMINLMNQLVQILQPVGTQMNQLPPQPIQVQPQPLHQMVYQPHPLHQRLILQ